MEPLVYLRYLIEEGSYPIFIVQFFSFLEHSDLSKSERYNHAYAVCNIYAFEDKKIQNHTIF